MKFTDGLQTGVQLDGPDLKDLKGKFGIRTGPSGGRLVPFQVKNDIVFSDLVSTVC